MHFGQKDTEDDSVRMTIFLQIRPLHLKGVSLFTSFPSTSSSSSSEDLTFESVDDEEEEEEDASASSPTPSPLSSTNIFADDDTEAVAAVEVARIDEAAVGMGGGKSSSSPVFIAVVDDDFVADFVADFDFDDDDI